MSKHPGAKSEAFTRALKELREGRIPYRVMSFQAREKSASANLGGNFIMAKERLIVIGGNAAGMSAASQVRRQRPEMEIIAFEQSPHTSYSA